MEQILLKAILSTVGRIAFSEEAIIEIVAPTASGKKQLKAYNLCNGDNSQSEIADRSGIDKGNLSRTINRWIKSGIMFKDNNGNPVHLYPVSRNT